MTFKKWKKVELDMLLKKRNQGVNTTTEKVKYTDEGIPVLRAQNITEQGINYEDITYVDEDTFNRIRIECKPNINDVLYTNIGSQFGTACIVNRDFKFIIAWNVLRLQTNDDVAPHFLMYALNNPELKARIKKLNTSSTMPFVSGKEIGQVEILIPDYETQVSVSSILKSIDDKILNNRAIISTLNEICWNTFQEYCANSTSLVENGFTSIKLGEVVKIRNGFPFKGTDFVDEGIPVLKIKNVKAGKILLNNLSYVTRDVADKAQRVRLKPNDLLITMSGNRIDGTADTWVGKVALFNKEGEYLLNQRVSIIDVLENDWDISKYFLSQLLSSQAFQYYFISNATSSGGQANISPDLIYNTEIAVPPKESMQKFHHLAKDIYNKIFAIELEIETLANLRDTLLPKLMKGEINV